MTELNKEFLKQVQVPILAEKQVMEAVFAHDYLTVLRFLSKYILLV